MNQQARTVIEVTKAAVLAALAQHIGQENGITASGLVIQIAGRTSAGAERRLRQCIEELRDEGIAICADPSTGYHIARDARELQASIDFLCGRIATTARQVRALKRLARPGLGGQRRLLL